VVGTLNSDDLCPKIGEKGSAPGKDVHLLKGQQPDTRKHRWLGHLMPP
jgi:hypothetical protein